MTTFGPSPSPSPSPSDKHFHSHAKAIHLNKEERLFELFPKDNPTTIYLRKGLCFIPLHPPISHYFDMSKNPPEKDMIKLAKLQKSVFSVDKVAKNSLKKMFQDPHAAKTEKTISKKKFDVSIDIKTQKTSVSALSASIKIINDDDDNHHTGAIYDIRANALIILDPKTRRRGEFSGFSLKSCSGSLLKGMESKYLANETNILDRIEQLEKEIHKKREINTGKLNAQLRELKNLIRYLSNPLAKLRNPEWHKNFDPKSVTRALASAWPKSKSTRKASSRLQKTATNLHRASITRLNTGNLSDSPMILRSPNRKNPDEYYDAVIEAAKKIQKDSSAANMEAQIEKLLKATQETPGAGVLALKALADLFKINHAGKKCSFKDANGNNLGHKQLNRQIIKDHVAHAQAHTNYVNSVAAVNNFHQSHKHDSYSKKVKELQELFLRLHNKQQFTDPLPKFQACRAKFPEIKNDHIFTPKFKLKFALQMGGPLQKMTQDVDIDMLKNAYHTHFKKDTRHPLSWKNCCKTLEKVMFYAMNSDKENLDKLKRKHVWVQKWFKKNGGLPVFKDEKDLNMYNFLFPDIYQEKLREYNAKHHH